MQIQYWGGSHLKFCRCYFQGFQKTPTLFISATYSFTAWAASSQTLLILINSSVRSRMGSEPSLSFMVEVTSPGLVIAPVWGSGSCESSSTASTSFSINSLVTSATCTGFAREAGWGGKFLTASLLRAGGLGHGTTHTAGGWGGGFCDGGCFSTSSWLKRMMGGISFLPCFLDCFLGVRGALTRTILYTLNFNI